MGETITSLIEKLEGAEIGSRELDCAIWTATGGWDHVGRPPTFSTSLDAALALAERVLPGWYVGVQANRRHEMPDDWTAYLAPPEIKDGPEREASSRTPALALCAAILRAQSEARV